MFFRSQQLLKEFADFKNGDPDGLLMILKSERARVFDYTMRMTGQLIRSAEVTDEALSSIELATDEPDTLQELLVLIYKTSRTFAIDVWNADTTKLENSAYAGLQGKDIQAFGQIEAIIRAIQPSHREVLLLRDRYGFALDEVAEIMGMGSSDVELIFAQALSMVENEAPELTPRMSEILRRMEVFARPENDGPSTQNLSLIMQDFRKSNSLGSSPWRMVRVGVLILSIIALWNFRIEVYAFLGATLGPDFLELFQSKKH
ncbi:MAG: hypothetical protein NTV34_09670 [Proteobacteria bacterium]|nr:hypothetical protein [Pseudomonadota bacterium]